MSWRSVRGDDVLVAVTRWTVRLDETGWGDTVLPLPDGSWTDRSTGAVVSGPVPAAELVRRAAGRAAGARRWLNSRCGRRKPDMVRLDVDGTVHPMTRSDDGWWRATVDARAGRPLRLLLDDDPTVLPDPRSPRQPDGVHERSQLWEPGADGLDRRRLGRPSDRRAR